MQSWNFTQIHTNGLVENDCKPAELSRTRAEPGLKTTTQWGFGYPWQRSHGECLYGAQEIPGDLDKHESITIASWWQSRRTSSGEMHSNELTCLKLTRNKQTGSHSLEQIESKNEVQLASTKSSNQLIRHEWIQILMCKLV